ncbi:MAG: NDP-sugar synthase [Candidatus Schekmanbacteria bacterium]|nr:NDP-sugar synthase [Candidatus Schekmanbacteria bacterium]
MKAMVLAAGRGERLKPLTLTRAKPAVPVFNKPMIVRALDFLFRNGIDEAVVNLYHLPSSIEDAVRNEESRMHNVVFSVEEKLLGTAGGLKKAESHFLNETFIMINSDTLLEFDIDRMLDFHRKSGAIATMLLAKPENNDPFGKVSIDEANRIIDILGMVSPGCSAKQMNFIGVHIFEPEILSYIPDGMPSEINASIYPKMIRKGETVMAYEHRGPWYDIGTLERYVGVQTGILKEGRRDFQEKGFSGNNCLSPHNEQIDSSANVIYSVIGKNCFIGKNSKITGSILLDNVEVNEGAVVENSIIEKNVKVAAGEVLHNCVKYFDPESGGETVSKI